MLMVVMNVDYGDDDEKENYNCAYLSPRLNTRESSSMLMLTSHVHVQAQSSVISTAPKIPPDSALAQPTLEMRVVSRYWHCAYVSRAACGHSHMQARCAK